MAMTRDILLFAASYAATIGAIPRGVVTLIHIEAAAAAAESKKLPKRENLLPLTAKHQYSQIDPKLFHHHPQYDHSDRRVIPWVSIAVLIKFLFFFRSFAAPFFDPLVSTVFLLIVL